LVAFGRILVLVVAFGSLGVGVCFGRITQEKLILGDFIDVGCIVCIYFQGADSLREQHRFVLWGFIGAVMAALVGVFVGRIIGTLGCPTTP
jgi:hypothetical protein